MIVGRGLDETEGWMLMLNVEADLWGFVVCLKFFITSY